jgi:Uma2 family endonuclease
MATFEIPFKASTAGYIIAVNVPEDVFMQQYAEDFCEWIDGTVIKMSPVHDRHDIITRYLAILLETYFAFRVLGIIRQQPFVMHYEFEQKDGQKKRRDREPDIMVILNDNLSNLKETYMHGAADIVIEVVSPESVARDYGEKFHEYEQIGVPEYWIIDPMKKECRFYYLNMKNAYELQTVGDEYESPHLPGLKLNIPTLWQEVLPKPPAIVKAVQAMLGE